MSLRGRPWLFEVATAAGLVGVGLLVLYPVLSAHFVLVDDHEILALLPPAGSPSDARPAIDLRGMAFTSDPSAGRFRPLYWTIRLGEVAAFGGNAAAWHALVLGLGLLAAVLLYATARMLGAGRLLAALLGAWLLVAPGVSSLWVRLGADDTAATFFFVLAAFAAVSAATQRRSLAWDVVFVGAALAAMLTKEAAALGGPALAGFRILAARPDWRQRRLSLVPASAWVVVALSVLSVLVSIAVGMRTGPTGYGGRYFAVPAAAAYVRGFAQNAVILLFVGGGWAVLLLAWSVWVRRPDRAERRGLLLGAALALLLSVPQLGLYSVQGIFEGKYEDLGALGVVGAMVAGLVWLQRRGEPRIALAGVSAWIVMLGAFGFSTWTYATWFREDSSQLDRLVGEIATSAPPHSILAIAADPGTQYEPILSLVVHVTNRGRGDLQPELVRLTSGRPYTPIEANLADTIATAGVPSLSGAEDCRAISSVVVLGDETETRAALPCLERGFRRLVFDAPVLLWGGDAVSLRPRLPGRIRVGYVLFVRDAAS